MHSRQKATRTTCRTTESTDTSLQTVNKNNVSKKSNQPLSELTKKPTVDVQPSIHNIQQGSQRNIEQTPTEEDTQRGGFCDDIDELPAYLDEYIDWLRDIFLAIDEFQACCPDISTVEDFMNRSALKQNEQFNLLKMNNVLTEYFIDGKPEEIDMLRADILCQLSQYFWIMVMRKITQGKKNTYDEEWGCTKAKAFEYLVYYSLLLETEMCVQYCGDNKPDGGVDCFVQSQNMIIQVKNSSSVGPNIARELIGTMVLNKTKNARLYTMENGLTEECNKTINKAKELGYCIEHRTTEDMISLLAEKNLWGILPEERVNYIFFDKMFAKWCKLFKHIDEDVLEEVLEDRQICDEYLQLFKLPEEQLSIIDGMRVLGLE